MKFGQVLVYRARKTSVSFIGVQMLSKLGKVTFEFSFRNFDGYD